MGCVEAQQTIDLASNVALQAADDLLLTEPLAGAASDVLTGTRIGGHSDQHDDPQGAISLSITAAVEAMATTPAERWQAMLWILSGPTIPADLGVASG